METRALFFLLKAALVLAILAGIAHHFKLI